MSNAKICVFCGEQPSGKTKEHVLPRWLIELTGDPNRVVNFGPVWGRPGEIRTFSFDSFQFPACASCNSDFSKLEDATAPIVKRMINEESVTGYELSVLLDWFDKVRVGIWLGTMMLDRNIQGIEPRFHIATRMRRNDRSVAFYRWRNPRPMLTFGGTVGPSFQHSPVCFTLMVNQVVIVNASWTGLCAKHLGFPYYKRLEHTDSGLQHVDGIASGTGRADKNVSAVFRVPVGGRSFHQAVFTDQLHWPPTCGAFIEASVQRRCRGMPLGTSQVFMKRKKDALRPLRADELVNVLPAEPVSNRVALLQTHAAALDMQVAMPLEQAGFNLLHPEEVTRRKQLLADVAEVNASLIARQDVGLQSMGYF